MIRRERYKGERKVYWVKRMVERERKRERWKNQ